MNAASIETELRSLVPGANISVVSFRVHGNKYFEVTVNGRSTHCCEPVPMEALVLWVREQASSHTASSLSSCLTERR